MRCSHPWVRAPAGISEAARYVSEEARLAATPLPCGQCLACRINKARGWVIRIMLECGLHEESCLATLTYGDENLPEDLQVSPAVLSGFMKRLRYYMKPRRIRFYGVGEYGELNGRPHYHVILFGVFCSEQETVEKAWTEGHVHIGEVTQEYVRYVAGYVVKGISAERDCDARGVHREFMRCSRNPGIGGGWCDLASNRFDKAFKGESPPEVRTVNFGGRNYPLSRYMRDRVNRMTRHDGMSEKLRFWDYQEDLFQRFDRGLWYDGVTQEGRVEREKALHNLKLYGRKRKL